MLQVTLELESNPFIFAGQQEVSCAPSEASSDIGIAKAAQPASHAPTDPSSPVTAEPASRASRFETGQQEVSCAPSEASSDIAKVAQPASRAPTVTAAPTHPRDTLASDNSWKHQTMGAFGNTPLSAQGWPAYTEETMPDTMGIKTRRRPIIAVPLC
ncbi:hypothetical protein JOQ06_006274 [Pogonophryne albipinna]|uniref:Uncharacterized protein n=1 Tax=Pogonophryne albipinna TaxID=1090488 RepID=A0AAD6FSG6_9TELE|nr:hypothetical protein JOQ06_006274 [Pogonophryne albipinna]